MSDKSVRVNTNKLAIAFAVWSLAAAPNLAHAQGLPILSVQVASALPILIAAGSVCVKYTYDANGNRTAQIVTTIGSGQTLWGAGTYGCYLWSVH